MAKRAKVPPTTKQHPALEGAAYRTTSGLLVPPSELPALAVVTPWRDHAHLHADYWAAMGHLLPHDLVVLVDDGSLAPVADHARGHACDARRTAVRLSRQAGFAPACNAGYRVARAINPDAVVVFLNNDVRLAPGYQPPWWRWLREAFLGAYDGLVGPDLHENPQHAQVDSGPEPYISGWCIAARASRWAQLAETTQTGDGPWCESYLEPSYYGDNDLCARARYADVPLLRAEVGLEHLRNVTAGPQENPVVMDASIRNRARWAETVARLRAERAAGRVSG